MTGNGAITPTPGVRRALVVIDVQNEYVTGNLRIEYPPLSVSLPNISRAISAAESAGVPIVVVQNVAPPSAPLFARGSHGCELHVSVASRSRDHFVAKALPSAFAGTDLARWLKTQQIDTVSVTGFMTHNCLASTIVEAVHHGLQAELLVDACGSVSYRNEAGFASAEDIHRAFTVVLESRFAAVVTTDTWTAAIARGQSLPGGSIAASHAAALALPASS